MLLLPLLFLGIYLYIIGRRVSATLIFFFFITAGFQSVPYPLFNAFLGIKLPHDFAVLMTFALFAWGICCYKDFIPKTRASYLVLSYVAMLTILLFISVFYYKIPFAESFTAIRWQLIALAYFPLRRLTSEQLYKTLFALWWITFAGCVWFCLQSITGMPIPDTELYGGERIGIFYRYYNMPAFMHLAGFMSLWGGGLPFAPSLKWRRIAFVVISLAVVLTFSRAAMVQYTLVVVLGLLMPYITTKRLMLFGIPIAAISIAAAAFVLINSGGGRTAADIQNISEGAVEEAVSAEATAEFVIEADNTLLFRLAMLYERWLDVTSEVPSLVFGKGLSGDKTQYTKQHFNYYIGLYDPDTGDIWQLYSPDISWTTLILRYGVVGTLIYVLGFCILFAYYHRRYIPFFLFGIMLLLQTVVSDKLYMLTSTMPLLIFFGVKNIGRNTGAEATP